MRATASHRNQDLGIDLGTANTLVHVRGQGIVLDEPSVVAVRTDSGAVLSVGTEAKQTIGRTPASIATVRPLRDGVIADYEAAEQMLRHFITKAGGGRRLGPRPRLVICVPSGITGVERRAVTEAAVRARARQVHLIEEPLAAAIGAGLPVAEPAGCMIVDIGGGTTEVAVIALGGIVSSRSVRVAGDAMDAAITAYMRREQGLVIGERSAEELKLSIGSASPKAAPGAAADREPEADRCTVSGSDQRTGLPRAVEVVEEQLRAALAEPLDAIVEAIRQTLDECPPDLAGDIVDRGLVLTGGGALLHGLDTRLGQELGVPVMVAEDPLHCVAVGTGRCVEDVDALQAVLDAGSTVRTARIPTLRAA